ncbi:MAG: hypothetical protein Q7V62_01805 [Actinomycetota bacterium]|nr:hypothetical protein [Actinomycetota bacterium]
MSKRERSPDDADRRSAKLASVEGIASMLERTRLAPPPTMSNLPSDARQHIASFLGGLASPHTLPLVRQAHKAPEYRFTESHTEPDEDPRETSKALDDVHALSIVDRSFRADLHQERTVVDVAAYAATFAWAADWVERHGQERLADGWKSGVGYTYPQLKEAPIKAVALGRAPLVVPMHINRDVTLRHPSHVRARTLAWNAAFAPLGTIAKMERFRQLVDRANARQATGYAFSWLPWDQPWNKPDHMNAMASQYSKEPWPWRGAAPLRDSPTPLEALLKYYNAGFGMKEMGMKVLLYATAEVYGVRAAHVTLAWLMLMHVHRVFDLGPKFGEEARFAYAVLQALGAQSDTITPDSIARAKTSGRDVRDVFAFDLLHGLLGEESRNGDPTPIPASSSSSMTPLEAAQRTLAAGEAQLTALAQKRAANGDAWYQTQAELVADAMHRARALVYASERRTEDAEFMREWEAMHGAAARMQE